LYHEYAQKYRKDETAFLLTGGYVINGRKWAKLASEKFNTKTHLTASNCATICS
jgi:hypothetical protein